MWELRWVLLGLGALIVIGVYLWGRGLLRRGAPFRVARGERVEPRLHEPIYDGGDSLPPGPERFGDPVEAPITKPEPALPERVITLRLVPHSGELDAEKVVDALRETGLTHGRYGIFHRLASNGDMLFSVASLTEPGTFDLESLTGSTLAGMSIFMILPGIGDPVARFDAMVLTARSLAVTLGGELYDERGSSWSVQRERYVREEVIEYRHQLERR